MTSIQVGAKDPPKGKRITGGEGIENPMNRTTAPVPDPVMTGYHTTDKCASSPSRPPSPCTQNQPSDLCLPAVTPHSNPYTKNERICVCNNFRWLQNCTTGCKPGDPCPKHQPISCQSQIVDDCPKSFHRGCIESYGHDADNYTCMKCEAANPKWSLEPAYQDLKRGSKETSIWTTRGERFGLFGLKTQAMKGKVQKSQDALKPVIPLVDRVNEKVDRENAHRPADKEVAPAVNPRALLDSVPHPFPSPFRLDDSVTNKARLHGRQYNTSMLSFETKRCDNCGKTVPTHSCPIMKQAAKPFEQRHLVTTFVGVWHCTCSKCSGSQYYPNKDVCITEFRRLHDGQHPTEFIPNLPDAEHDNDKRFNWTVCKQCHDFFGSNAEKSESFFCFFYVLPLSFLLTLFCSIDMQIPNPLSKRCGFGPVYVPYIPRRGPNETDTDRQRKMSYQLYRLLSLFTPAEESAIRRITPLLSVVMLGMGNIASKGCTSCVWQESKLATILPNLPSECNYIVIDRQRKGGSKLKSTKVERAKIQEALHLLAATGLTQWDVTISSERLNQWPENGDICDLVKDLTIVEVDVAEDGSVSNYGIVNSQEGETQAMFFNNSEDSTALQSPMGSTELDDQCQVINFVFFPALLFHSSYCRIAGIR